MCGWVGVGGGAYSSWEARVSGSCLSMKYRSLVDLWNPFFTFLVLYKNPSFNAAIASEEGRPRGSKGNGGMGETRQ